MISLFYTGGDFVGPGTSKVARLDVELRIGTLVLTNSADPDEIPHNAAFHLGFHCLINYPFRGFQSSKG